MGEAGYVGTAQGQLGGPLGSCGSELFCEHGSALIAAAGWGREGVGSGCPDPGSPGHPSLMPCLAHGLWCQDCTLANSSHCAPKQCQPTDTVCASVRITDPSSSKPGPGEGAGLLKARSRERSEVSSEFLFPGTRSRL